MHKRRGDVGEVVWMGFRASLLMRVCVQSPPTASEHRYSCEWSLSSILQVCTAALQQHEALLREEQAVRGIDALDEASVQQLLAIALREQGFGVFRETPYPQAALASRAMQSASSRGKSARERCDLVLTAAPHIGVRDEAWPPPPEKRAKPTREESQLSLFLSPAENAQEAEATASTRDASRRALSDASSMPTLAPPHEACWIELKVVGQFTIVEGFAQPNSSYASLLTAACASDIKKLSALGQLARWSESSLEAPVAASLLVLFTLDQATAEHDLPVALHRAMDRGALFKAPIVENFAIQDRIGNACCTLAMIASIPEV
jgi:hypothetical protein